MTTLAQGIEVEQSVITLPCRDSYSNGVNQVTSCQGRLRGVVQPLVGDGVTPATYPTLLSPHGFDFDGGTDYLTIPDNAALSFGDGALDYPFSLTALVLMDDATNFPVFVKGDAGATIEYWLATRATDLIQFLIFDGTAGGATFLGRTYNTPLTYLQNQRIHVAGTYDGSRTATMKIYINGVRVDDAFASGGAGYVAMRDLASPVRVGSGGWLGTYANGRIYGPAIWPVELTPLQVSMLYARERSRLNT